ncbi:MAG: hypothetical protein H6740_22430 [Alphaproteobacteria bacterium]|nr:hypothetical protein [Alphaproteobacteria bacterium]
MHAVAAIVRNDLRRVLRDQFLLGMAVYILGMAVAMRWLLPWVQGELLAAQGFDLTPYYALGVSYFVLVNASVLTGLVAGFLLLETREERTIHALRVTPVPLSVHLGTLGGLVVLSGFVLTTALSLLIGLGVPAPGPMLLAAALTAPTGVTMALILATAASNKVEAFAVMKIVAVLGMLPLGGYFVPEPAQWLVGLAPPYWGCKLWWMAAAGEPGWGWLVIPGVLVSGAWVGVLLRRFEGVVGG